MEIKPLPLSLFVSRLKERKPFAMQRMGDGEMQCILRRGVENCDHSTYFADLGIALARTLTQPRHENYFLCIGPKAAKGMASPVNAWLSQNAPALEWYDSETFLNASVRGELFPLIHVLNHRRVVMVGAPHLARLWENGLMRQPQAHIVTPTINAWLDKERIARQVLLAANPTNPNTKADVILFSAGMTSKVLIWLLFPIIGAHTSLFDTGSLWDYACGVDSRSYARRMTRAGKLSLVMANFGASRYEAERALSAGEKVHA